MKYWISKGAQPTLRVSRILGEMQLMPMPKAGNNPLKAIPKKERKKEATKEEPKAEAKKEEPKAEAKKEEPKAEAKKEQLKKKNQKRNSQKQKLKRNSQKQKLKRNSQKQKLKRNSQKKIKVDMLEVKIFTLYPDLYPGPLNKNIFKKARENKIWNLKSDKFKRLRY